MTRFMKCAESTGRRVKDYFKAFGLNISMNGVIVDIECCRRSLFVQWLRTK